MLKIRKEQYRELGKVTLKQFEEEMVGHIQKYFPKYYEIYGEPLIRKVIQYGIKRAESYGFVTKRNTPLYIDLMLLLGSHFDEDLQYPWARQILSDKAVTDPIARADQLYDRAMQFMDEAWGENNEYLVRAKIRVKDYPMDQWSLAPEENIESRCMAVFKDIWMNKYVALGNSVVFQLSQLAKENAQNYGITSERGIMVFGILMLILGSGFDEDIQYPWASSVLQDATIQSTTNKMDGLYKAAIDFFNKWFS
jgi:hypothetical protein